MDVDRWITMPLHEAYGLPEPDIGTYEIEPWVVIDAFEDDPPLCTCDLPEKAQKVAEALNIAERVSARMQERIGEGDL